MGGLALDEVQLSKRGRLLRKELLGPFVNGSTGATGTDGASIAITFQALGRDPTQSPSIFMTTVTDAVGSASFLGFTVLFMPMLQA
jgi:Mg/Co/Ni transporter MgtE